MEVVGYSTGQYVLLFILFIVLIFVLIVLIYDVVQWGNISAIIVARGASLTSANPVNPPVTVAVASGSSTITFTKSQADTAYWLNLIAAIILGIILLIAIIWMIWAWSRPRVVAAPAVVPAAVVTPGATEVTTTTTKQVTTPPITTAVPAEAVPIAPVAPVVPAVPAAVVAPQYAVSPRIAPQQVQYGYSPYGPGYYPPQQAYPGYQY